MENAGSILRDYYQANHNIISRGVKSSIVALNGFINEGFPDSKTHGGYLKYLNTLALMFDSHHLTEDEVGFPFFAEKLPDTHFEWLHEDHDLLTGFLEELRPIVESLAEISQTKEKLVKLKDVLLKIEDRWSQHMELEEDEYVNQIDALSTYDESVELINQFFAFKIGLIKPYELSIPFMIYNLAPEERKVITSGLDPEWLGKVESAEWIEKWGTMQPFLNYQ